MLIRKRLFASVVSLGLMGASMIATSALAASCGDGVGPCSCDDTVVVNTTLDPNDPVTSMVCLCNGLTVDSGVTLDLGGHSIRGSGVCSGIGVSGDAVTVANGHIINFSTGLGSVGIDGRFAGLDIERNDSGVFLMGPRNLLEQSVVHDNRGVGIRLGGNSHTVRKVGVARNGQEGIIAGGRGFHLVENSVIADNGSHGVALSGDGFSRVRQNVIRDNDADGIFVGVDFFGTIVRNVISGNGRNGFELVFGNGFTIDHNRITANGENGMRIAGHGQTVTSNITSMNGGGSPEFHGMLIETGDSHFERNRSERNGGFGMKATAAGNTYESNICSGNGLGDSDPKGLCR